MPGTVLSTRATKKGKNTHPYSQGAHSPTKETPWKQLSYIQDEWEASQREGTKIKEWKI